MKYSILVLAMLASVQVSAWGQTRHHHWAPLLVTDAETVDIDTATVERGSGTFTTWLRWDLDRTAPPVGVVYRIEQVELDCRAFRIRVVAAEAVGSGPTLLAPDNPPTVETGLKSTPIQLDSLDTQWRVYSRGSLGEQAVHAACRRLTRA
jgi:hypothetical protein